MSFEYKKSHPLVENIDLRNKSVLHRKILHVAWPVCQTFYTSTGPNIHLSSEVLQGHFRWHLMKPELFALALQLGSSFWWQHEGVHSFTGRSVQYFGSVWSQSAERRGGGGQGQNTAHNASMCKLCAHRVTRKTKTNGAVMLEEKLIQKPSSRLVLCMKWSKELPTRWVFYGGYFGPDMRK